MRLASRLLFAALAVALAGCPEYDKYQIELKPDGKALARKLTCWRERAQNGKASPRAFSADTLAKIEKVYGQKPVEDGPQHYRFEERFAGRMPQDVGGSGNYIAIESPLGAASVYMERFRGDDDLVAKFERLAAATNRLTDILLGWFETQMRDDANWPKVRQVLDVEFRRDLHNAALYIRLAGVDTSAAAPCADAGGDENQAAEVITVTSARLLQYLIDHQYLEPAEFLEWVRRVRSEFSEPSAERVQILKRLQQVLAAKAKLDPDDAATSLAFMAQPDQAAHSFREFLRHTPEYERLSRGKSPPPEPEDIVMDIIFTDVYRFRLFESVDQLELSLTTTEKPAATNGCWDDAAHLVRWQESIDAGDGMPTLCFAVWSQPDVAFQEKHFGRVVIRGSPLAEYAAEYSMLSEVDRAIVDRFVDALSPNDDLKAALRKFVSDHKKSSPRIADVGELLSAALQK